MGPENEYGSCFVNMALMQEIQILSIPDGNMGLAWDMWLLMGTHGKYEGLCQF